MTLPAGFEALEPFVPTWATHSAAARDGLRTHQSAEARQAFYDTMNPLLIPALDRLDAPERAAFEADYRRRVAAWYPPQADGRTLFPFRRLFIVALRGS